MNAALGWFALRGAMLALAWFCLLNVVSSVAVALAIRPLATRVHTRSAGVWFGLRMFPALGAATFVGAIFLPSYWQYEPRDVAEGFDLLLTIGAGLTIAALVAGAVRGLTAWRRAAIKTRAWMRTARPLAMPGTTAPAFEIDVETPVLALVGVLRPRLLVTRGLIAMLTADELAAAVAHEIGHWRAWDNLKRLLMRSAPDVLPATPAIRTIERRWASSSEHGADRIACEHDPHARCALASALVKVARFTPPVPSMAVPISTLVGGGDIASRVRRLLDDRTVVSVNRLTRAMSWAAATALIVTILVTYAPLLRAVHEATEILVRSLP